jgi:mRNA interferase YafQ
VSTPPLRPVFTGQFKKDRKRAISRGWDVDHLDEVMRRLIDGEQLEATYKVHPLRGNCVGHSECHIESDFLLIWYYAEGDDGEEIVFVRTGTHSDLFGR